MTQAEIKQLQTELNTFSARHKDLGRMKLRVDGTMGDLTKKRIHEAKWDLGYLEINATVNENFFKRLHHPTEVHNDWHQDKAAVARGKSRRRKRRLWVKRNQFRSYLKRGVSRFDGVPVAKTAIPVLEWCRKHGWKGTLVSGYRTPAYSESLCYAMCGRPSCPGRCAGRATNHAYADPSRFAIDVSDYINFAHVVAKCPLHPKIHNSLPNDRVHFSPQGN
jgi:hypothetical protein